MTSFATSAVPDAGNALPWRTLLLVAAATALYLVFGDAPEDWVFDRAAILQGEWWRLLSAHWVHSDGGHAFWDIAMLFVLGALFEPLISWRLPGALLLASLGVDAWLWWGEPDLDLYCGLSGILNSLLFVGLLQMWYDHRHPLVALTAVLAVLKIVVEATSGQPLLTHTAWPSVPIVHAAGVLSGVVVAAVFRIFEGRQNGLVLLGSVNE